jgi:PAS domain S-box-containing protein
VRYGFALVALAAIVAIRLELDPVLGHRAPLMLFTVAVMAGAFFGGLGPGLLVTAVAAVVGRMCWMEPTYSLVAPGPADQLQLVLFVAIGAAISGLCHRLRRAKERADDRAHALRASEARHRRILETASEGVWTIDADGTTTFVNRSLAEMLGTPARALIGRPAHELLAPGDATSRQRLTELLGSGGRAVRDLRLRTCDGTTLPVSVASARLEGGGAAEAGATLAMVTDLSQIQRTERRLARLLASEQAARADAERANTMKDEFLATVSHELRTPLNAILGWVSMLRRDTLDAARRDKAITVIERNARSQSQLIDDLLDVSRMITGRLTMDRRPTALGPLVRAAADAVLPEAEAKSIRLELDLLAHDEAVLGDRERLRQVVWNLLSNALKFTPAGRTIHVATRATDAELIVEVRDEGQGIAAEFLPHVFDRFRQEDGSTRRAKNGLGLGLAIVHHIVELHGGRTEAESEGVGRGATFRVRLPRLTHATAPPPARDELAPASVEPHQLDGVRVLVVEDDEDSREVLSEILVNAGAHVRAAASADEAWEVLHQSRPDIMVSDIAMPHDDGYALLRRVRTLPKERGGDVPAVAVTAHARECDRRRALEVGFQRHVAKPIDPRRLIAAIRELLRRGARTA